MANSFKIGNRLNGTVKNVADFGVFINLPGHKRGLVHKSDFQDFEFEKDKFTPGQKVRVVVTDLVDDKINLSLSRVNDMSLVDPDNPFNDTDANKFTQVLTENLEEAKKSLAEIEKKNNDLK